MVVNEMNKDAYIRSLKVQIEGLDWAWRDYSKHAYLEMFDGDAGMQKYESKRLDYVDERLKLEGMIEKVEDEEVR